MKTAYLYKPIGQGKVQCRICSHYCKIDPGKRGICRVRENRGGTLVSLNYDHVIAANADPVEKKPLFHFKPGSRSFSIAAMGCNLSCRFCQNADIAQVSDREDRIAGSPFSPGDIVAQAIASGCRSIAYTYTEPSVFFELALDTARLAKAKGLYNIFVTNGFMSPELLDMAGDVLDAANVDLKAYSDGFYRKLCNARLEPVKETLRLMLQKGVMVEVTTLIIPGVNDDPDELGQMAEFICHELGPQTPWHLSRFHPTYRLTDRSATPVHTLETACRIGEQAGLRYVYTGNVRSARENTTCHHCGKLLVERRGYAVKNNVTDKGNCPGCGTPVYGIF
ncbi:MAG TPA: AmmeMemoRadiSam system radical SAM enzyme [Desulfobacteraceae bacterium]|nr:AmmeMemoRadiSam system radical SAM enzyme [Desulfobacteraceae bacterium]